MPIYVIVILTSRERFLVYESCSRCPDDPHLKLPDFQAKIYVLISSKQMFIEPGSAVVDIAPHHHTCGGDGGNFARARERFGIAVGRARAAAQDVIGSAAAAKHYTGMLNREPEKN